MNRERDGGREVLDEVGLAARREPGEGLVDDRADGRALGLEGPRGETQREQISVLAVLRRVHVQQVTKGRPGRVDVHFRKHRDGGAIFRFGSREMADTSA